MSDDFEALRRAMRDPDLYYQLTERRGPRPGFWEGRPELIGSNLGVDWRVIQPTTVARRGVESGPISSWLNRKVGSGIDFAARETGRAVRSAVRDIRDWRRGRRGGGQLMSDDDAEETSTPEETSYSVAPREAEELPEGEDMPMFGGPGWGTSGRRSAEQRVWEV